MSRKTRRAMVGRGSVLLISTLLIGSAALRIGISADKAFAEGTFDSPFLMSDTLPVAAKPIEPADRARLGNLLEALQAREAKIKEREVQLDMREKALDVARFEVDRRIAALTDAETRLGATLARARTAAEDDVSRLTTVYENMKPKDAAAVFSAMEPDFAAGFLARMRPDAAAKVLSGLDPQIAYSISAILAGRNAGAPKN